MGSRKEEIVMAAMELAAEHGLSNVSMSMIADRVGIKKPSLYKHFASKEELVEDMYQLIRDKAREISYAKVKDHSSMFAGRNAQEILQQMVADASEVTEKICEYGTLDDTEIQKIKDANERREQKNSTAPVQAEADHRQENESVVTQNTVPDPEEDDQDNEKPDAESDGRRFVICTNCGEKIWL